jgi:hypothetical protein
MKKYYQRLIEVRGTNMFAIIAFEEINKTYDMWKDFGIPVITFLASIIISAKAGSKAAKREYGYYKTNLMAGYFSNVFDGIIVDKLPIALAKIDFDRGKLNLSFNEVTDILVELIDKALFFSYFAKDFYNDFSKDIMEIEDYLVMVANQNNVQNYMQEEYKNQLEIRVRKLYKTLHNFYISTK